jgi:hypothetical protein
MEGAEQHKSLAMFNQHFVLQHGGDAGVTIELVCLWVGLLPINRGIASQYPEALFGCELLIDRPHERKELFEKSAQPAHRLCRVSPYFSD